MIQITRNNLSVILQPYLCDDAIGIIIKDLQGMKAVKRKNRLLRQFQEKFVITGKDKLQGPMSEFVGYIKEYKVKGRLISLYMNILKFKYTYYVSTQKNKIFIEVDMVEEEEKEIKLR